MTPKIWNYSQWITETNPQKIRKMFDKLLVDSKFNVLSVTDKHFQPQGYTALWLLSESHFAIHTFPEFSKTYIELSSCNLEYYQTFIELTKDL